MINKANVSKFHTELNEVLANLGSKYGIKLSSGHLTYFEDGGCRVKVEGIAIDKKTGVAPNKHAKTLGLGCSHEGLDLDVVKAARINEKGATYMVVGYNTRAKTMPWILQDVSEPNAPADRKAPTMWLKTQLAELATSKSASSWVINKL